MRVIISRIESKRLHLKRLAPCQSRIVSLFGTDGYIDSFHRKKYYHHGLQFNRILEKSPLSQVVKRYG